MKSPSLNDCFNTFDCIAYFFGRNCVDEIRSEYFEMEYEVESSGKYHEINSVPKLNHFPTCSKLFNHREHHRD